MSGILKTSMLLAGANHTLSLMLKPPASKGNAENFSHAAAKITFHFWDPSFYQDAVLLCVWPHQLINTTDKCLCLLF